MRSAKQILDDQFLEMRWRCLSLAADLDRLADAPGGSELLSSDPRVQKLLSALQILTDNDSDRAQRVQMLFSDTGK